MWHDYLLYMTTFTNKLHYAYYKHSLRVCINMYALHTVDNVHSATTMPVLRVVWSKLHPSLISGGWCKRGPRPNSDITRPYPGILTQITAQSNEIHTPRTDFVTQYITTYHQCMYITQRRNMQDITVTYKRGHSNGRTIKESSAMVNSRQDEVLHHLSPSCDGIIISFTRLCNQHWWWMTPLTLVAFLCCSVTPQNIACYPHKCTKR